MSDSDHYDDDCNGNDNNEEEIKKVQQVDIISKHTRGIICKNARQINLRMPSPSKKVAVR